MLQIAVLGATGRMGGTVVRCVAEDPDMQLCGALSEPGHEGIGGDIGPVLGLADQGVTVTDDPAVAVAGASVVIDFTLPAALRSNLAACEAAGVALVIGTTGLSNEDLEAVKKAGENIPVVYGRNMSVGVNVFTEMARLAARYLGPEWDIEITEAHHRYKADAPSGTALQIGEAMAAELGRRLEDVAVYGREGQTGAREHGAIGFNAIRAGSIVGEHSVLMAIDEEIVELTHRAQDRATFARGALRAARWLGGRTPGYFTMRDVLGFQDRDTL